MDSFKPREVGCRAGETFQHPITVDSRLWIAICYASVLSGIINLVSLRLRMF